MNILISIKLLLIPLTLTCVLVLAPHSQALATETDQKEYPGTTCVVYGANAKYVYDYGFIHHVDDFDTGSNGLPANVYVTCPIVRDLLSSNRGLSSVRMYIDNPDERSMHCSLRVIAAADNFLGYEMIENIYDFSATTNISGTFFEMFPRKNYSSNATYQAVCQIPPRAKLLSYKVVEREY